MLRSFATVLVCALLAPCTHARPAVKPRPTSKSPKTTSVVLLVGRGPASFQATFSSIEGARIYGKPLRTLKRTDVQEGQRIAAYDQGFLNSVGQPVPVHFVLLRLDQERATVKIEGKSAGLDRGFTLHLQSADGFRVGQVLPVITPTEREKSKFRVAAVLDYSESCFGDVVRDWGGSYHSTSGTVRVTSVSRNHIAFALQNVRLQGETLLNVSRGAFTANGFGEATLE